MSDGTAEEFAALESALGYRFRDRSLLACALSHASYAHEQTEQESNERLEFLGDSVLDLVLSDWLYRAHPDWSEGDLTLARKALVNTEALAERARELDLGTCARLGRSELRTGGSEKTTVLANLCEALLGALYLDGGLLVVSEVVLHLFGAIAAEQTPNRDPKTRFQEWAHAELRHSPNYRLLCDSGVENDERRFSVAVYVGEECFGEGCGRTKRAAERSAAEAALERFAEPRVS